MPTKTVTVKAEEGTNIAAQISRIQSDRDRIRAKLVGLSLATSSDNLDILTSSIESIANNGAVDATVKEGESYTIPKGYHNGSGVVKGVSGGGNYSLQTKTATPTKEQQSITSDEGYYGLSSVTVEPIPETYQDVTSVTATSSDVLSGKIIVTSSGEVTPGTMFNNGEVSKVLDTSTTSYTIPVGYHNGQGVISIITETKNITPTKFLQDVDATPGKVLSKVTVDPIPDEYIITSDATATSADIKQDLTAYVNGMKLTGTMPIISTVTESLGVTKPSYTIPEGYHDGTGTVSISLETKTATPTKMEQTIVPTDGKALSSVIVNPIPEEYITTTDATATADQILYGSTAYVDGNKLTGTMPNNGATNLTIDGMLTTDVNVPAGYTTGGTVSITDSIENALSAI